MSFFKEFREFAVKGNVIDLAIGVIIGGAFQKIVDSLIKDVIMPLISKVVSLDFSQWFVILKAPEKIDPNLPQTYENLQKAGAILFAYGQFATVVLNFLILAFVIFLVVKQINRLKRAPAEPAASAAEPIATPEDIQLLREIRDALTKQTTTHSQSNT